MFLPGLSQMGFYPRPSCLAPTLGFNSPCMGQSGPCDTASISPQALASQMACQQQQMLQLGLMIGLLMRALSSCMNGMGSGMPGVGQGGPGMGGTPGFGQAPFPMGGLPTPWGGGGCPAPGVAPQPLPASDGSGQAAVNLGRQFLGQNSSSLKGRLPNFQAAGGETNNCADFVSTLLNDTGRLTGHPVNVTVLEHQLQQQGYHAVPQDQAQPGDVWISASRGHTEMVSEPGGRRLIGSNNDKPTHQIISEGGAGAGVFYHRD